MTVARSRVAEGHQVVARLPAVMGVVMVLAVLGSCTPRNFGPADSGITYSFINNCPSEITVGRSRSSARPVIVGPHETASMRTLDDVFDSTFFVTNTDTGSVTSIAPRDDAYTIEGSDCP